MVALCNCTCTVYIQLQTADMCAEPAAEDQDAWKVSGRFWATASDDWMKQEMLLVCTCAPRLTILIAWVIIVMFHVHRNSTSIPCNS